MRDVFGADAPAISEGGAMSAVTPPPAAPAAAAALAAPVAPPGVTPPTLTQAVDKAVAKAAADVTVATDPHAVHSVKLAPLAPTVLGSTAAGAVIGSALFPGPGTLVGAGIGWLAERYQIGGGVFGKVAKAVTAKFKTEYHKIPGSAPAPK